jgi:hypothetical protein
MWEIITRIADLVGILTFIIFITTLLLFRYRTARYRKNLEKRKGGKPVALVISLKKDENIKRLAEQFLKENKTEMPIEEIDEESVSLELLPQLRKKIIETKRKINDIGAKEVHLFYQGPVAFAFFIADTLNNWIPVYIYHLNKEKGYECWGLLTETLERQATENFIKEITKSG